MVGEGPYPSVSLGKQPLLPGGPWYHGRALKITVPDNLQYTLKVRKPWYDDDELITPPSNPQVLYDSKALPVMRTDMLETLQASGVDNLETFPTRLIDEVNNITYDNYVTFNIIGLVAAADLEKSELMPHSPGATMLDTDFHSLVIDESKTKGLLLFRLAENCSAIMVHHSIKEAIEAKGIPGIVFYADGEWAG
jgi:hypothetical protein